MKLFRRKNSKNWHFKFTYNGRKIERSTGKTVKKDAEDYAASFRNKLVNGDVGLITRIDAPTYEIAAEDYFKSREFKNLAPNTIRRNKEANKPLLKFFGKKRMDHISTADIEYYINKRSQNSACRPGFTKKDGTIVPPKKTNKLVSSSTINKELSLLKKLFKRLHLSDVLPKDPSKPIKKLKETNEEGRVLSRAEEKLYLDACRSQDFKDFAILLGEFGTRPEELCCVKIKNINVADKWLFIPDGKTKAARRYIPLTNRALEVILRRLNSLKGFEYLFPGGLHKKQKDRHIKKFNNAHYGALRRSKIDGENRTGTDGVCTLYSWRHTFATRFVESGGNLIALGALLGHSDLKLLMRYSHPSDEHKSEAINRMSEFQEMMRQKEQSEESENAKMAHFKLINQTIIGDNSKNGK